jgi:hypothetical protein
MAHLRQQPLQVRLMEVAASERFDRIGVVKADSAAVVETLPILISR